MARWVSSDYRQAAEHLCDALQRKCDLNDQLGIPFCVELLAWVMTATEQPRRAAVFLGAADRMWELIGTPMFGYQTLLEWREHSHQLCREALGPDAFAAAHQEGGQRSQEEIITHALGPKAHSRAATATPDPPETVLTTRERQVAALVAAGMSNREIAAHLVVSQRTAEGHVEHILTKLGFTSRTQIATWTAEQRDRPTLRRQRPD